MQLGLLLRCSVPFQRPTSCHCLRAPNPFPDPHIPLCPRGGGGGGGASPRTNPTSQSAPFHRQGLEGPSALQLGGRNGHRENTDRAPSWLWPCLEPRFPLAPGVGMAPGLAALGRALDRRMGAKVHRRFHPRRAWAASWFGKRAVSECQCREWPRGAGTGRPHTQTLGSPFKEIQTVKDQAKNSCPCRCMWWAPGRRPPEAPPSARVAPACVDAAVFFTLHAF